MVELSSEPYVVCICMFVCAIAIVLRFTQQGSSASFAFRLLTREENRQKYLIRN